MPNVENAPPPLPLAEGPVPLQGRKAEHEVTELFHGCASLVNACPRSRLSEAVAASRYAVSSADRRKPGAVIARVTEALRQDDAATALAILAIWCEGYAFLADERC